jgi:glutamate racemase
MAQSENISSIGILDFGIGGLGLYKLLREAGFQRSIKYFSDSGFIPYGTVPKKVLLKRVEKIMLFFKAKGISKVMIACNAASSILDDLHVEGMEIKGIIGFGIEKVIESGCHTAVLFGGGRTVRSGIYRKELEKQGLKIKQRITQSLSIYIEAGDISSEALRKQLKNYLSQYKSEQALILACTHYPAILPLIKEMISPSMLIIDPAEKAAEWICKNWNSTYLKPIDEFYTTGNAMRMKSSAMKTFGVELKNVLAATL